MSSDGETTLARDGGDDDYFYDEIFGKSAFTDEKTSAAIKELSSPKPDDEWPDLIFDDDPFRWFFLWQKTEDMLSSKKCLFLQPITCTPYIRRRYLLNLAIVR